MTFLISFVIFSKCIILTSQIFPNSLRPPLRTEEGNVPSSSSSSPFGVATDILPRRQKKKSLFLPFFPPSSFSVMYARDMYFSPSAKKRSFQKNSLFCAPSSSCAKKKKRRKGLSDLFEVFLFGLFSLSSFLGGSSRHQRGGDSPFPLVEAASLKNSPGQRTEGEKKRE